MHPPSQVDSKNKGGLLYPNKEFFAFTISIEKMYLYNLTDSKLIAYPSNLNSKIGEALATADAPVLMMKEVAKCLPLEHQDMTPPRSFYDLIFKKYGMTRAKDLSKNLDRAHESARGVDASAAGVTHRANITAQAASARKKAKATH